MGTAKEDWDKIIASRAAQPPIEEVKKIVDKGEQFFEKTEEKTLGVWQRIMAWFHGSDDDTKLGQYPLWMRFFMPLFGIFLAFYFWGEWSNYNWAQMNKLAIVFNQNINQLCIAAYRFAFMAIFVAGFVLFCVLFPFFFDLKKLINELNENYKQLTAWQKTVLFYGLFVAFCVLFVLLLMVRLPDSISSGGIFQR